MDSSQISGTSSIKTKSSNINGSKDRSQKVNQELRIIVEYLDDPEKHVANFQQANKSSKETRSVASRILELTEKAKQIYNNMKSIVVLRKLKNMWKE